MALKLQHILIEMTLDNASVLEHVGIWRALLRETAVLGHATILNEQFHQFEPVGVTGILMLAESHISVHTWPEHHLAALDIFTCGPMDIEAMLNHLRQTLQPTHETVRHISRN